ncbi:hypothetical protein [Mesorhizobium sp. M0019]|uniref:hypothetical protein n=1 Tax=Mesorhizobium sp. M0019 TaxID=2956845 RepID=UPI0033392A91
MARPWRLSRPIQIADLTSGVVGVFFSVLENKDAYDSNYYVPIIKGDIGRLDFEPNEVVHHATPPIKQ